MKVRRGLLEKIEYETDRETFCCEVCGLAYARGIESDEREHAKQHDQVVNGVRVHQADGIYKLTTHCNLFDKIRRAANAEMRYDFGGPDIVVGRSFALILVRAKRAVSYLIVSEKSINLDIMACIWMAWTARGWRRCGLASILVEYLYSRNGRVGVSGPISAAAAQMLLSIGKPFFWLKYKEGETDEGAWRIGDAIDFEKLKGIDKHRRSQIDPSIRPLGG